MKTRKHAEATVEAHFQRQMKDPKFRRLYEKESRKVRLGYVINQLRNKAGLTQAELALRVGVTQGQIAKLETAETRNYEINTLKKIAAALHKVLVIGFAEETKSSRSFVEKSKVGELLAC